jgi:hypothetical protein
VSHGITAIDQFATRFGASIGAKQRHQAGMSRQENPTTAPEVWIDHEPERAIGLVRRAAL